jgi:hypothetical protein
MPAKMKKPRRSGAIIFWKNVGQERLTTGSTAVPLNRSSKRKATHEARPVRLAKATTRRCVALIRRIARAAASTPDHGAHVKCRSARRQNSSSRKRSSIWKCNPTSPPPMK